MTAQSLSPSPMETVTRRDRRVVLAGLLLVALLAWAYIIRLAAAMQGNHALAMPQTTGWSAAQAGWLAPMWMVMMVAMMLPSVAPAVLRYAGMTRERAGDVARPAAAFTLGYLSAWAAFGALAALTQSALHSMALLSPTMRSVSPVLGGSLLIAAGIYQWLPFKARCLDRCRMPGNEFASEWRAGAGGGLILGFRHGLLCVQCCWLLMLLLFVAGVMNLVWVAAIAGLVLVERVMVGGAAIGMLTGSVLAAWGVWVVVGF